MCEPQGPDAMTIRLFLYASLRPYARAGSRSADEGVEIELPEGATCSDLIAKLGIAPQAAALLFVNGVHEKPSFALKHSDRVAIFPPIGGG